MWIPQRVLPEEEAAACTTPVEANMPTSSGQPKSGSVPSSSGSDAESSSETVSSVDAENAGKTVCGTDVAAGVRGDNGQVSGLVRGSKGVSQDARHQT